LGSARFAGWTGTELTSQYAVREFTAVPKRANFRSLGLLRCLGFIPAPTDLLAQTGFEPDEVVLYLPVTRTTHEPDLARR
jgi:hypothetical protein